MSEVPRVDLATALVDAGADSHPGPEPEPVQPEPLALTPAAPQSGVGTPASTAGGPIDEALWERVGAAAPYDPYSDLPEYATVPPLGSDAGRGNTSSTDDAILEAHARASGATSMYAERARPSWAIHAVALCGLAIVPALILAEIGEEALVGTRFDGIPPAMVVWTILYPVFVLLTLLDISRAQREHVRANLFFAVFPPLQVLARIRRHRSMMLVGSTLGSAAMFAAWFAPYPVIVAVTDWFTALAQALGLR